MLYKSLTYFLSLYVHHTYVYSIFFIVLFLLQETRYIEFCLFKYGCLCIIFRHISVICQRSSIQKHNIHKNLHILLFQKRFQNLFIPFFNVSPQSVSLTIPFLSRSTRILRIASLSLSESETRHRAARKKETEKVVLRRKSNVQDVASTKTDRITHVPYVVDSPPKRQKGDLELQISYLLSESLLQDLSH